jgi:hypothetical protein
MKKLLLIGAVLCLLASCASMKESEFLDHSSMYKNFDHAAFSVYGYNNVTPEDQANSTSQNWWGIPVR